MTGVNSGVHSFFKRKKQAPPTIIICTDQRCVFVVFHKVGFTVHVGFHFDQACFLGYIQPASRVTNYFVPAQKRGRVD